MTSTTAIRAPERRARPRRRALLWASALLGILATGALGVSFAVVLATSAIEERLAALAADAGLEIEVSAVDVPLIGDIALRGVTVRRPSDGRVLMTLDAARSDVDLFDALGGQRRPGAVRLEGGDLHLSLVDGALVDFEGLLPAKGDAVDPAAAASPTPPIAVTLQGWRVTVDVEIAGMATERVSLVDLQGNLRRDTDRRLSLEARAIAKAAGHQTDATVTLSPDGDLDLRFDDGLQIGVATPAGPVWLGLDSAHRSREQGATALVGLRLRRGADRFGIARLTVEGGEGLWPRPSEMSRVSVSGVSAERGGSRLVAAEATVELAPAATPGGPPTPTRILAEDIGVETRDRAVRGTFEGASISLVQPWEALAGGRPLDAIAAVALGRPRLTATIERSAVGVGGLDSSDLLGELFNGDAAASATRGQAQGDAAASATSGQAQGEVPGPAATGRRAKVAALLARARSWKLAVTDGEVDVHDADGQPIMRLDGVGLATREAGEGLLEVALRAAVSREGEETGRIDVQVGFDASAHVAYANGRISGRDLAHQVSRFSGHVDVQPDAHVDITFNYLPPIAPEAPHRVEGTARLEHFTFQYWRVADTEVKDLEGQIDFDLAIYPRDRRVVLALPAIRVGEARLSASLDATQPRGERARFDARVAMARQSCGAVARAIPRALIPRLSRLSVRGTMRFDASLKLDLDSPRELELSVDGDLDGCHVLRLGPGIDLGALKRRFVHRPREPERGTLRHVRVGRGTREWIDSEDLPDLVKDTAWITEDRRFSEHGGVRWDLIERALKMDLEHERFVYGGSTVTQQLVKNLYLDRGKTLARKLEEAIIAWQMERVLTKDEILTIYVNVIEYGPDIYGVKHAARFYFNKHVQQLDPLEVAFIMGLKPYPSKGYQQWEAGALKPWWVRRVKHVLAMVAKRTDHYDDIEQFAPFQPTFRRPTEAIALGPGPDAPDAPDAPEAPDAPDDTGGAWTPWGLQE